MAPTALVTGASGGIGTAIVRELGHDHDVVVHYHSDRESVTAVAEAVRATGQDAVVHGCDVSGPDAVGRTPRTVRPRAG